MNDKVYPCDLDIEEEKLDGTRLAAKVEARKDMYRILQSYTGISFSSGTQDQGRATIPVEETLGGRVFDDKLEIRWVREGDTFRVWTIQERENPNGSHESTMVPYYLYGTWKEGRFKESVVLDADLNFPLTQDPQKEWDRAFIEVALYRPAKPKHWSEDPESIVRALNAPAVSAHRFVRLRCGRDQ